MYFFIILIHRNKKKKKNHINYKEKFKIVMNQVNLQVH